MTSISQVETITLLVGASIAPTSKNIRPVSIDILILILHQIHGKGLVSRLATIDPIEVCPLSREVMFQPLSEPLQPGIRFFYHLMPTWSSVFLAVHLPLLLWAAIWVFHVPYLSHDWVRVWSLLRWSNDDVFKVLS